MVIWEGVLGDIPSPDHVIKSFNNIDFSKPKAKEWKRAIGASVKSFMIRTHRWEYEYPEMWKVDCKTKVHNETFKHQ